jgi:hypothetical protein
MKQPQIGVVPRAQRRRILTQTLGCIFQLRPQLQHLHAFVAQLPAEGGICLGKRVRGRSD